MEEKKAIVFDIGRFRNTDGPGIRTILFFKGCPLRCLWCSNPFGFSPGAPVGGQSGQVHRMRQVCAGLSPGEQYPGARGEIPGGFFRLPGVRGLCTGVSHGAG